jgi:hypothetical protein
VSVNFDHEDKPAEQNVKNSLCEFKTLIPSRCEAATEMARRRGSLTGKLLMKTYGVINVASAAFKVGDSDGYMTGPLVGEAGEVVSVHMIPEVA